MIYCVNGYKKPRFLIYSGAQFSALDVSFKYQGLKEYWDEKMTRHEGITGKLKVKYRYIRKYFELDYSGLIQKPDTMIIQQVLNAFYANKKVVLIPHTDNLGYFYEVKLMAGEKSLGLHYGGVKTFGNKDLIIMMEAVQPLTSLGWQDPDDKLVNLSNIRIK